MAPFVSILLVCLSPTLLSPILFALGVTTATLVEYIVHAYVLHGLRVPQHLEHHRRPQEKIYSVYYLNWLLILPTLLIAPAFTAGVVYGYWYYLLVHHCDHHDRQWLSPRLLAHHDGHHKFSKKNFGVSTIIWDQLFGTRHG